MFGYFQRVISPRNILMAASLAAMAYALNIECTDPKKGELTFPTIELTGDYGMKFLEAVTSLKTAVINIAPEHALAALQAICNLMNPHNAVEAQACVVNAVKCYPGAKR